MFALITGPWSRRGVHLVWGGAGGCSHLGPENDCFLQVTESSCWNPAAGDCQAHREGRILLALLQGGHLSLYLTVQRRKSRKSSCSRAPGRCQDQRQVPGTSDWQLIWNRIMLSACLQVLCRGVGRRGRNMGESIKLGSLVQREGMTLMSTVMMTVTVSVMEQG